MPTRVPTNEYRRAHDQEIRGMVEDGGVILGRAAAVVLRDVPHALHVRMSGPVELRVQQAMLIEDVDQATARWRQATEDMARDTYVRHFYGLDPEDPALYHLTIDSTRLTLRLVRRSDRRSSPGHRAALDAAEGGAGFPSKAVVATRTAASDPKW